MQRGNRLPIIGLWRDFRGSLSFFVQAAQPHRAEEMKSTLADLNDRATDGRTGMQEGDLLGGKYRIIEKIGSGGEGSVYLAMHVRTELFWAVKEIRACNVSDAWHEAGVMKNLKNRHLASVIDVYADAEAVYLVMEYVRGTDLGKMTQGGRTLNQQQVLEAGLQTAEALCYLASHSPPVCHLDIKPSNLICQRGGCIRLVDFGAALRQESRKGSAGTDGYAAPEQYDPCAVKDIRTDIYGLGASMYRLASGKKYSPALSTGRVPGCGDRFSEVILKCLRQDPGERYQCPADLQRDLLLVRRFERREKSRRQVLAACALGCLCALLCSRAMPEALRQLSAKDWDYDGLIAEASCVNLKEAAGLYREAIFMDPDREEACFAFLRDFSEDGQLSAQEEETMRDLLHTVRPGSGQTYEETLAARPTVFGEAAAQIGLLYWYGYEGEDADRIATGWFRKAAEAGGQTEEAAAWKETASMYLTYASVRSGAEIQEERPDVESTVMEGAAAEDPGAAAAALSAKKALLYWETCGSVLEHSSTWDNPIMRLEAMKEVAWELAFRLGELSESGITVHEISGMMAEIIRQEMSVQVSPEQEMAAEVLREEIREAEKSLPGGERETEEASGWEEQKAG